MVEIPKVFFYRPAQIWREKEARYRLRGSNCPECGIVHFPGRPVCPDCGFNSLHKPKEASPVLTQTIDTPTVVVYQNGGTPQKN